MDDDKKRLKSRNLSRKKTSRVKSRCSSKHPASSVRRRKKKSKIINQRSVEDVQCFPIPFIDFLCGCGNNYKKGSDRIKKISSKRLTKRSTWEHSHNKASEDLLSENEEDKCSKDDKKGVDQSNTSELYEGLPKGLTEPIPIENLKINTSMRHILANVKLTSIFGCPNVPKSMSQIKILLANNPSLKQQLKQILGENLKNDNMKTISDLLASEESTSEASIVSSKKHLNLSKSIIRVKKIPESSHSSDIISKICSSHKSRTTNKRHSHKSIHHCSKSTLKRNSHQNDVDNTDSQSVFTKILSIVFGTSKTPKNKHKIVRSRGSSRISKEKSKVQLVSNETTYSVEKTRELREKYDEWCKKASKDVRERFGLEDYVRVTKYLIDNPTSSYDGNDEALINQWLKSFSKEINRQNLINDERGENIKKSHSDLSIHKTNNSSDLKSVRTEAIKDDAQEKDVVQKITSNEMLNINDKGAGDVISRLNNLMKELLESSRNDNDAEEQHIGDGEEINNVQCTPQPGCSKWKGSERNKLTEDASLDQVKIMCASFVEKLTKHNSREMANYSSEIPWNNKDFQVFCVPSIENNPFNIFGGPEISDCSLNKSLSKTEVFEDRKDDTSTIIKNATSSEINNEGPLRMTRSEEDFTKLSAVHIKVNHKEKIKTVDSALSQKTESSQTLSEPSLFSRNNVKPEMKNGDHKQTMHQKKVSFEDDPNMEFIPSNTEINKKEWKNEKYEPETHNESISCEKWDENQHNLSLDNRSIVATYSSSSSKCSVGKKLFLDQLSISTRHSTDNDSIVNLKFIEDHQGELIDIFKHLITLSNQNPNFFQQAEEFSSMFNKTELKKECIGIQCKLSEEDPTKHIFSDIHLRTVMNIAKNGSMPVKYDSETTAKKVRSECDSYESGSVKFNSSSSDSGIYSKSSTSHRRFSSLPDVLDGAPVVGVSEQATEVSSKEEETVERKESTGSSMTTSLSTSISAQVSQTPDIDNFSQSSTSDLSETIYKTMETRSSSFSQNIGKTSSEKSQSSENSMDSNSSKIVRSKLKRLLRRLRK